MNSSTITCGLAGLSLLFLACAWTCLAAAVAVGENWNQFRGPNQNGAATGHKLPTQWGPETNIIWKKPVAGVGWSQPIVWGERIFITTADPTSQPSLTRRTGSGIADLPRCFPARVTTPSRQPIFIAGKFFVWTRPRAMSCGDRVAEGPPTMHIHANNTYASETPATDGERIVAYFGMTGVYCYDLAGNPLWQKDIGVYPTQFGWGTGSSPVIHGEHVYIQCDNDKSSFFMALNKTTGEQVCAQSARKNRTGPRHLFGATNSAPSWSRRAAGRCARRSSNGRRAMDNEGKRPHSDDAGRR